MPTWIHTADVAAGIGWFSQIVVPTLTMCWTQPGDDDADGSGPLWQSERHRCLGLEEAVEQPDQPEADPEQPRAAGSGYGYAVDEGIEPPAATARRYCTVRSVFHATSTTSAMRRTKRSWWNKERWNAERMKALLVWRGWPIPGMALLNSRSGVRAAASNPVPSFLSAAREAPAEASRTILAPLPVRSYERSRPSRARLAQEASAGAVAATPASSPAASAMSETSSARARPGGRVPPAPGAGEQ